MKNLESFTIKFIAFIVFLALISTAMLFNVSSTITQKHEINSTEIELQKINAKLYLIERHLNIEDTKEEFNK